MFFRSSCDLGLCRQTFPGVRCVLRATPVTFCVLGLPLGAAELP